MPLILICVLIVTIFVLMKTNFIVFDRSVFEFQISGILKRNKISNLREYTAIHNYIEQTFEKDPDYFGTSDTIKQCNAMMVKYHDENP